MYNAAVWLAKVKESYGDNLQIDWQPFCLEQINQKDEAAPKVWEQPEALLAHRGGEAAKRQGLASFDAFLLALLKARHEDRRDLAEQDTILDAAQVAGLDVAKFREDLADKSLLQAIGQSHTKATEEYGVFGVPTFIFPDGTSAFLKTYRPKDEEAVEMFEAIYKVMSGWKYVGELKRPQPPWPQGVFA